ncbi:hypothetical protein HPB50_019298 [Hyalomma asiaticum]|uniref:Uncharacterized protein n=1 Tax=Hyalomma asiaticum TaxID=266040 RepID=A0ACB7T0B3_HYAAI|nr:hypothetical protein HPB50_019298 [Hyalomma asiaticum]
MVPPRLEAAAKSCDQDRQFWAVLAGPRALGRQGPNEPPTVRGGPRLVKATSKTTQALIGAREFPTVGAYKVLFNPIFESNAVVLRHQRCGFRVL